MAEIIAFIGLGNMGSGMAANLIKNGFDVRAFDLAEEALARAEAAGAIRAASAADAASTADVVVTMLPTGKHVAAVYNDEIFAAAKAGALFLDCSTIDISTARRTIASALDKGFAMADAPVSGGIGAANGGTLTFMVGGQEDAFIRAKPILSAMGKKVIHAGGAGSGQAAKICNNMLLGATMVATSEAFAMAEKLGLDPQIFYDISSVSSGQSWSMTSYCPLPGVGPKTPADNDYQGGFAIALMLKDLKLALDAASSVNASVPMGAQAESLYQVLANKGEGGRDFSYVIQLLS
ncbi:3-hydroxyisobutyrate dehydrogenase 2 (plasmid) [Rhizobium phaseoli]|uniref:3-hydroxyisobutyrate dehydrogenase n=1 Tax=Rhizobium phaseoli TaxID=396 RepID=UPI0007EA7B4C|nr:3-hydroxyisobutyrate dehydrogenase [Rhizobium phaseoli]ANL51062.1 3-hydroxyisobutyrate dehydrogenase 2 [Rhizobium phaseoli]